MYLVVTVLIIVACFFDPDSFGSKFKGWRLGITPASTGREMGVRKTTAFWKRLRGHLQVQFWCLLCCSNVIPRADRTS